LYFFSTFLQLYGILCWAREERAWIHFPQAIGSGDWQGYALFNLADVPFKMGTVQEIQVKTVANETLDINGAGIGVLLSTLPVLGNLFTSRSSRPESQTSLFGKKFPTISRVLL
jgi:hypothetical protein